MRKQTQRDMERLGTPPLPAPHLTPPPVCLFSPAHCCSVPLEALSFPLTPHPGQPPPTGPTQPGSGPGLPWCRWSHRLGGLAKPQRTWKLKELWVPLLRGPWPTRGLAQHGAPWTSSLPRTDSASPLVRSGVGRAAWTSSPGSLQGPPAGRGKGPGDLCRQTAILWPLAGQDPLSEGCPGVPFREPRAYL